MSVILLDVVWFMKKFIFLTNLNFRTVVYQGVSPKVGIMVDFFTKKFYVKIYDYILCIIYLHSAYLYSCTEYTCIYSK